MNTNDSSTYAWQGAAPRPRKRKPSAKALLVAVILVAVAIPLAFFAIATVSGVLGEWRNRAPEAAVKEFIATDAAFRAFYAEEEEFPAYHVYSSTGKDGVYRVRVAVGEDDVWTFVVEQQEGAWVVTRYQRPAIEKYNVQ